MELGKLSLLGKAVAGILIIVKGLVFGDVSESKPVRVTQPEKVAVIQVREKKSPVKFEVPDFVKSVPSGDFAGVSVRCRALAEARRSAGDDVVRQILGSINASYSHKYSDIVSGDARKPRRVVSDQLDRVASGIVLDVERSIVRSVHRQVNGGGGNHVVFVLVRYGAEKIAEMRRLSRGSQVIGEIVSDRDGIVQVRVFEVNGVSVVFGSADISVEKRNRYSKAISLFVWKVPAGSKKKYRVGFDPVKICGSEAYFLLDLNRSIGGVSDVLLGAKVSKRIELKGVDEIGREVVVSL